MRKGYYMDLNGYSNFVVQKTNGDIIENYTMTFACVPYTYESNVSGIVSAFSVNDKKGIAVGVKKKGIVVVRIGLGNMVVEIESLQEHLKFQKSNIVTVAFWGTAGWCDLYVNGRLSNRKQFPRHSKTFIPSGEYYIGKYVDENHFLKDTKHGVFHGEVEFVEFTKEYLTQTSHTNKVC